MLSGPAARLNCSRAKLCEPSPMFPRTMGVSNHKQDYAATQYCLRVTISCLPCGHMPPGSPTLVAERYRLFLRALIANGMSQDELATKLRLSTSALSRHLSGKAVISQKSLKQVAAAIRIPVSFFYDLDATLDYRSYEPQKNTPEPAHKRHNQDMVHGGFLRAYLGTPEGLNTPYAVVIALASVDWQALCGDREPSHDMVHSVRLAMEGVMNRT